MVVDTPFLPPYKKDISLNFIFNILGAILNVVSFAVIVPILRVLFQMEEGTYDFTPWADASMFDTKVWIDNFYFYMTQFIDTYGQATTLLILGVFLVVMTAFKVGVVYLSQYFIVSIRTGVVRDVRTQINNKILELPLGFFSNERKGDIIARMTGDVQEIENSVMSSLEMVTKNPILISIYLGTMFVISWQLTLFVLVFLPIAGYIMGQVGKKLKRQSREAQEKQVF